MVDVYLVGQTVKMCIEDKTPPAWIMASTINDLLSKAGISAKVEVSELGKHNIYSKGECILVTLKTDKEVD